MQVAATWQIIVSNPIMTNLAKEGGRESLKYIQEQWLPVPSVRGATGIVRTEYAAQPHVISTTLRRAVNI